MKTKYINEVRVLRVAETAFSSAMLLDGPDKLFNFWREVVAKSVWYNPEVEHVVAVALNTKFKVLGFGLISIGSINETVCHPREVFRLGVALGAYTMIVMHNHPSGDPTMSTTDLNLLRRLRDSGKILAIDLMDFIVIGDTDYASASKLGVI